MGQRRADAWWHASRAGASLRQVTGQTSAVDFVVRSRGAAAVSLLLARAPKQDSGQQGKPSGCLEIALDPDVNRTGDLWHICVEVRTCPFPMPHPPIYTIPSQSYPSLLPWHSDLEQSCAAVYPSRGRIARCILWDQDRDAEHDVHGLRARLFSVTKHVMSAGAEGLAHPVLCLEG